HGHRLPAARTVEQARLERAVAIGLAAAAGRTTQHGRELDHRVRRRNPTAVAQTATRFAMVRPTPSVRMMTPAPTSSAPGCSGRPGGAEREAGHIPFTISSAGRIRQGSCEINVVKHCNLSCRSCAHLSPIVAKEFVDPRKLFVDLRRL